VRAREKGDAREKRDAERGRRKWVRGREKKDAERGRRKRDAERGRRQERRDAERGKVMGFAERGRRNGRRVSGGWERGFYGGEGRVLWGRKEAGVPANNYFF